jgi:hypothetical protein
MSESTQTFPEIEIAEVFFCPHCGEKLFIYNEPYVGKCPHLILGYIWAPDDMFLAIRPDYGKALLQNLIDSEEYKSSLEDGDIEPIREDLQERLLEGKIDPNDHSALELAIYLPSPHRNLPSLLPEYAALFKSDGMYSGVHFVVSLSEQKEPDGGK